MKKYMSQIAIRNRRQYLDTHICTHIYLYIYIDRNNTRNYITRFQQMNPVQVYQKRYAIVH